MRGFEPPASRPPDVHSNRAELHPELWFRKETSMDRMSKNLFFPGRQIYTTQLFFTIIAEKKNP